MKPVIQEEKTGCAIASSAAIAGISYKEAKQTANALGIYADDPSLWSDTTHITNLLSELGFKTYRETPFSSWEELPDCALLLIKWHLEKGKPFWHWVVFTRENGDEYILDSNKRLKNSIRTDFGRMKPKWYMGVERV